MTITGMTKEQIEAGVERIENACVQYMDSLNRGGTRWRVKLNVISTRDNAPLYRRSARGNGRKVHALCWHGFREVMREWFKDCPGARLVTGMATYDGSDEFELYHAHTGQKNIGSLMYPMRADNACDC